MFEDGPTLNISYPGTQKVLAILQGLSDTKAGSLVYHQVRRLLLLEDKARTETERAYASVLGSLLGLLADGIQDNLDIKIRLGLLHALLQPPLTPGDLQALVSHLGPEGSRKQRTVDLPQDAFRDAVSPLLRKLGLALEDGHPITTGPAPRDEPPVAEAAPAETGTAHFYHAAPPPMAPQAEPKAAGAEQAEKTREELQEIKAALLDQVSVTMESNQELAQMLRSMLGELHHGDGPQEPEMFRGAMKGRLRKLIREHAGLSEHIETAGEFLRRFDSKCQQLDEELGRAKLLSYTDELTGLANRRAFIRRLETELGRVQRYEYPLALAVLDLDLFKAINDKHGHAVGDQVLRCYTGSVLSTFRTYDMVARYGGEEFAVLLPHTDHDGARRALGKVRQKAQETHYEWNGSRFPVPTFSAGIALYRRGESPDDLIARADTAMYEAKRLGRNRIEVHAQ